MRKYTLVRRLDNCKMILHGSKYKGISFFEMEKEIEKTSAKLWEERINIQSRNADVFMRLIILLFPQSRFHHSGCEWGGSRSSILMFKIPVLEQIFSLLKDCPYREKGEHLQEVLGICDMSYYSDVHIYGTYGLENKNNVMNRIHYCFDHINHDPWGNSRLADFVKGLIIIEEKLNEYLAILEGANGKVDNNHDKQ